MIGILWTVLVGIACFVTYASVTGIGSMFTATAVPIMMVWCFVELGKYVAMSYTYNYWRELRLPMQIALSAFIVVIMAFTSVGVFAYLGQSYQSVTTDTIRNDVELKAKQAQLERLSNRIAAIDKQVADIPSTVVAGRIKLITKYDEEKQPLAQQRDTLQTEVAKLDTSHIDIGSHTGMLSFVAQTAGLAMDKAVLYMILVITLCLDPFAMLLGILINRLTQIHARENVEYLEFMGGVGSEERMRRRQARHTPPRPRLWSDDEIRDRKFVAESAPIDNVGRDAFTRMNTWLAFRDGMWHPDEVQSDPPVLDETGRPVAVNKPDKPQYNEIAK